VSNADDVPFEHFGDLHYEVDRASQRYAELAAERDRLRAVVDDALAGLRQLTDACREAGEHETADAMAQVYRTLVAQLDVSPAGEDT
jgi:hypothetical protein